MARRILILVSLLIALPRVGLAQADEPAPTDEEDGYAEPTFAADADDPGDEDPVYEPPPEEGPSGEAPHTATASVVVDERQSDLEREQRMVEDEGDGEMAQVEEDNPDSLDHEFQLGLRAGAGVPFIFGLAYAGGPPCNTPAPGEDPDTFCLHVGAGIMDFDVSFGVTPDLEITALGRIGMIGVEPTNSNLLQFGLGIRAYMEPEGMFKLFLGARALLDFTEGPPEIPNWGDIDFGVRGEVGLQLDLVRYFGLYIEVGVNIMFLRGFTISPDATGGLQIRFP